MRRGPTQFVPLERLIDDFGADVLRLTGGDDGHRGIIGVPQKGRIFADLRELAQAVERGKAMPEADDELSFAIAAQLFSELTPARLVLHPAEGLGPTKEEGSRRRVQTQQVVWSSMEPVGNLCLGYSGENSGLIKETPENLTAYGLHILYQE